MEDFTVLLFIEFLFCDEAFPNFFLICFLCFRSLSTFSKFLLIFMLIFSLSFPPLANCLMSPELPNNGSRSLLTGDWTSSRVNWDKNLSISSTERSELVLSWGFFCVSNPSILGWGSSSIFLPCLLIPEFLRSSLTGPAIFLTSLSKSMLSLLSKRHHCLCSLSWDGTGIVTAEQLVIPI